MKVVNNKLYDGDGKAVTFSQSKNYSKRKVEHEYLIIHYTAGTSAQSSIDWLKNPLSEASAHLVIARDGEITQLVGFDKIAWHAGKSQWKNRTGLNKYSIGIELDNAGRLKQEGKTWTSWSGQVIPDEEVILDQHKNEFHESGWHSYTEIQLQTLLNVSSALLEEYEFLDILGHDDIAPNRKTDPGPAFPMQSFKSMLLGRSSDEADYDYEALSTTTNANSIPISSLKRKGKKPKYDPYILKDQFQKYLVDKTIQDFATDAIHVREDDIEIDFNSTSKIIDTTTSQKAHRDGIQLIPKNYRLSGGILRNITIKNAKIESSTAQLQTILGTDGRFEDITIKDSYLSTPSEHGITLNGLLSGSISGITGENNASITLNPTRLGGGVSNIWIASELDKKRTYKKIKGLNKNSISVLDNRNILIGKNSIQRQVFLDRYINGKKRGLVIKNFSFPVFLAILSIGNLDGDNPTHITKAVIEAVKLEPKSEIIYSS